MYVETPRSLNIYWNLNFLHELLIRLNKLYNYGSFPLKKNFHGQKIFRKYHYYKSWKCSLQNFFPTENLCWPIIFYKIFFLTQMFLSGPLFIRTCTCFPVQCSSFSTSLDTDHSASWRFNNSLQSQYFFKLVNIFLAGCIRGVEGEGMPIYRRSTTNGNLYIKFNVVFPEKNFLDEDKLKVSLQCCKGLVFEYTITLWEAHPTLANVLPLISKYRQAGQKKTGFASYFHPACCI